MNTTQMNTTDTTDPTEVSTSMVDIVFYLLCHYSRWSDHLNDRRFWRRYSEFPIQCSHDYIWTAHHVCGYCNHSARNRYMKPENDEKRIQKQNTLRNKSLVVKRKCLMRQREASSILIFSRRHSFPENSYIYELIYCHLVGIDFIKKQYI